LASHRLRADPAPLVVMAVCERPDDIAGSGYVAWRVVCGSSVSWRALGWGVSESRGCGLRRPRAAAL